MHTPMRFNHKNDIKVTAYLKGGKDPVFLGFGPMGSFSRCKEWVRIELRGKQPAGTILHVSAHQEATGAFFHKTFAFNTNGI